MYLYLVLEAAAWVFGGAALLYIFLHMLPSHYSIKKKLLRFRISIVIITAAVILGVYANKTYPPDFAMPVWMHSFGPDHHAPTLPFANIFNFFLHAGNFERVLDIARDPSDVPTSLEREGGELVKINLTVKEVISEIAPGVYFNYWTFDGQVPGPMLRVVEGDTVELSLTNDITSIHSHNIDLHAVTGPGGGASLTNTAPGETKIFRWKALNPGLYIYHCASMNVSVHNSHGQYGLILVEPRGGLPKVDKEFYLVQGEFYTAGGIGRKGLTRFDSQALLDGIPNYIVFNGRIPNDQLYKKPMQVNAGDRVRIFVGNGGVNLISSFHVIGEIFDSVYPEGAMGEGSAILKNVQTTAVLPGGSAIVEFTAEVPGNLTVVDHALARMNKGAWATIGVIGSPRLDIFQAIK